MPKAQKSNGPRFGEVAVDMGYVGSHQVRQALQVQQRHRERKKHVPFLGEILIDLGHLNQTQCQQVMGSLLLGGLPTAIRSAAKKKSSGYKSSSSKKTWWSRLRGK